MVYDHDATEPHPFRDKYNPGFNNERMELVKMGQLKIDYLNE